MSATEEIRQVAETLGWERLATPGVPPADVYCRGQYKILVVYRRDGSVRDAHRLCTWTDKYFQEAGTVHSDSKNKKPTILGWFADY